MNSIRDILNFVRAEALEHGGMLEVPDNQYGAGQHYHSGKKEARRPDDNGEARTSAKLQPIQFDLELIEEDDGTLTWEE